MPGYVDLSLACIKESVALISELVQAVNRRDAELRTDRICGHWLGLDVDCSATVTKEDAGYMVSMFRNHIMIERLPIVSDEGKLRLYDSRQAVSGEVSLFDNNDRLVIGEYGTFIRDHVLGCVSTNDVQPPRRGVMKRKHSKR
jgi:hypothetical protein